jgi:hypothetical protein
MNLMNSGMGHWLALVDMRQRKLLKRFVGACAAVISCWP